ncbi:MAG: hypothetical protein HYS21_14135 [Deltaproteobacteria bacterium]|nr:hypothetical protein [Deltaproteobacteria bacterium]
MRLITTIRGKPVLIPESAVKRFLEKRTSKAFVLGECWAIRPCCLNVALKPAKKTRRPSGALMAPEGPYVLKRSKHVKV